MISTAEIDYIANGIADNMRNDGRTRLDYQQIELELGLLSLANGSCKVKKGSTLVIAGVKVEVAAITPEQIALGRGNHGRVLCSVKSSVGAFPSIDPRDLENYCALLAEQMTRGLDSESSGLDFASLSIIPDQQCWLLMIDCLILTSDGSLMDSLFLATRGALADTKIPNITIEEVDGVMEFEIEDDVEEDLAKVKGWENVPVCITLYKYRKHFAVGANSHEEEAADMRMHVLVDGNGQICSVMNGVDKTKTGNEPHKLLDGMRQASGLGIKLIKAQNEFLQTARVGTMMF